MDNRITVVTGGSSGLGLELVKLIAQQHNVCVLGKTPKKVASAVAEVLDVAQGKVISFCCDLSEEKNANTVFARLAEQGFVVDRLINCAGAGHACDPVEVDEQLTERLIDSNMTSVIYTTTAALKSFGPDGGGTVVTVLSTAALKGNGRESVYCAAKWGARGYMEALKAFYKGTSTRIITVCPGGIDTPFWTADYGQYPDLNKFMKAPELAAVIWDAIKDKQSLYCSHIVLERLK